MVCKKAAVYWGRAVLEEVSLGLDLLKLKALGFFCCWMLQVWFQFFWVFSREVNKKATCVYVSVGAGGDFFKVEFS